VKEEQVKKILEITYCGECKYCQVCVSAKTPYPYCEAVESGEGKFFDDKGRDCRLDGFPKFCPLKSALYSQEPQVVCRELCSCGNPQSFPIPHEHDLADREKQIIKHYELLLSNCHLEIDRLEKPIPLPPDELLGGYKIVCVDDSPMLASETLMYFVEDSKGKRYSKVSADIVDKMLHAQLLKLQPELDRREARIKQLELGKKLSMESDNRIEQAIGKVLGYPAYKDDQKNFPNATEANGVCVGDHVAESLVMELVGKFKELEAQLDHDCLQCSKDLEIQFRADQNRKIGFALEKILIDAGLSMDIYTFATKLQKGEF
jgi:hypothetical protein